MHIIQPKKLPLKVKLILSGFLFLFSQTSLQTQGQGVPITLSGFNSDLIVDPVLNTAPGALVNGSIDLTGNVFYSQGYSNNAVPYTNGLPVSGAFTSNAGHNFQLAPYTGNNVLQILELQTRTISFAPAYQVNYSSLFILATAGGEDASIDYTVNFTDGSSQSASAVINDWFCPACTDYAIKDIGRVRNTDGSLQGIQFALYEFQIDIAVPNQSKQVAGIGFTVPLGEAGVANIFGVSGIPLSALPVAIDFFNARPENGKVVLQWKTAQELNGKQFIIERTLASQPNAFSKVGTVRSTSQNGALYNFSDVPNVTGTYLYRLIHEDMDGNMKTIGIRRISIGKKSSWVVQDHGSSWQLISSQPLNFRLIDRNGRVLRSYSGSGNVTIPKPASQGVYELQLETGGEIFMQRLLK